MPAASVVGLRADRAGSARALLCAAFVGGPVLPAYSPEVCARADLRTPGDARLLAA